MFPSSPQNLRPQPNSGSTPSTKINSVDQAIQRVNSAPITSSSDAMVALRTLSALPYTDYSIKVAAHSQLIQTLYSSLGADEKATFVADVKKYYNDYPYLGSQVSAKLPADQKQAIFGNAAGIKFEPTLYAELKRSSISQAPIDQIITAIAAQEAPAPEITIPKASQLSAEASAKDLYLQGIRTTAMLGDHELQPLANLIGRPIVVVRAEPRGRMGANNVEVIAYPEGRAETPANAVFVQNIMNGHFKTFTPNSGAPVLPGTALPGTAREGDYRGAGSNDCLIASIKGSGVDFGISNREVRGLCANYQDTHGLADNYVPDVVDRGRVAMFGTEATIPIGFIGPLMIKNSDDVWAQGEYSGGRIGNWEVRNDKGLFAVSYDQDTHAPIQVTQTGEFLPDGKMGLLDRPTEFSDINTALHLITVH